MTEFQQLQDAAAMTTKQVAEYFEVTERTAFRWKCGESKPSPVVMRAMSNLSASRVNQDVFGEG